MSKSSKNSKEPQKSPGETSELKSAREACRILIGLVPDSDISEKHIKELKTAKDVCEAMKKGLEKLKENTKASVVKLNDLLKSEGFDPKDNNKPPGYRKGAQTSKTDKNNHSNKDGTNGPKEKSQGSASQTDKTEDIKSGQDPDLWTEIHEAVSKVIENYNQMQKRTAQQTVPQVNIDGLLDCAQCKKHKEELETMHLANTGIQNELEQLKRENRRMNERETKKQKNDSIENKLDACQKLLDDERETTEKLKSREAETKIQMKRLQDMFEEERGAKSSLEREINALRHQSGKVLTTGEDTSKLRELEKYIVDLENRLGAEMSKKISSDESALENISIRNRPMNIASDYNQFCSNAWLTAKERLDRSVTGKEDEKCRFLALVLMTSLNKAEADFKYARSKIIAMTQQPLQVINGVKVEEVLKDKDITAEETALGDIFRKQADQVNLSSFKEAIIKEIKTYKPFKDFKKYFVKGMENYVHECALLTWKMVIQRPPMTFEMDTEKAWRTLEKIVEPAWGSNLETKKPKIQYYQYPVMYHGANVMVKGKAVVR